MLLTDFGWDDQWELAKGCRFADCRRESEPGCAVQQALDAGRLSGERLASFRKLQREIAFLERKVDKSAGAEEKQRIKAITKTFNRQKRNNT